MPSIFDMIAGNSTANPNDPAGAYLGNLNDPQTAGQFQAARNQLGDQGFWQGVLQASSPRIGVGGPTPAAAGLLGQMQAQASLPQESQQMAATGNLSAEALYKRLQGEQLANQIANQPAFFRALLGGGQPTQPGTPGAAQPGAAAPGTSTPGLSPYAAKTIQFESPDGQGGNGGGYGQFQKATWLTTFKNNYPAASQMGDDAILALRNDPEMSGKMIDAYGRENAQILASAGVQVNDATLRGAHWLGPGNAVKVFSSSPDTPLANFMSKDVLAANHLTGMTTGDFANKVVSQMGAGTLTVPGLAPMTPGQPGQAPGAPVQVAQAGQVNPYTGLPMTPPEALKLQVLGAASGMSNLIPDTYKNIANLPVDEAKARQQKQIELDYAAQIARAGAPWSRAFAPHQVDVWNPATQNYERQWATPPVPPLPGQPAPMPSPMPGAGAGAVGMSPAPMTPPMTPMAPTGPQPRPMLPSQPIPGSSMVPGGAQGLMPGTGGLSNTPPAIAPTPSQNAPMTPGSNMIPGGAQGLMPGSFGIAKPGPTQEKEMAGRGEDYAKYYESVNTAAETARAQQANLLTMRNDAPNIYTGPGAETLLGFQKVMRLVDPAYDQPVQSAESFVKNGGTLIRSAVRQESARAAAQEFTMIKDQLPGLETSPKGLQETLGEFMGFNDYNIAKANAMSRWVEDPTHGGSVKGFEAAWRQNVDPYTFLIRRMEPEMRQQLFSKLSGSKEGQAALRKLAQQDQFIEQNGLGPSF